MGVPVIRDSIVYVGTSDDRLPWRLILSAGKRNGRLRSTSMYSVARRSVIQCCISATLRGELLALEVETGKMRWKFTTPGGKEQWEIPDSFR